MPESHYAHTLKGEGPEKWQPLTDHLDGVAELASAHATAFGSAEWGRLAGRWHDLGKYAEDFQTYLKSFAPDPKVLDASVLDDKRGKVDHSSAGAVHVLERCAGRLTRDGELPAAEAALAMVIAGHHSGLPERVQFESARLTKPEKQARLLEVRRGGAPETLLGLGLPPLPALLRPESFTGRGGPHEKKLRYEFWTRMLFSALIDADRLDTERAMNKEQSDRRERSKPSGDLLLELLRRVDVHLERVAKEARDRSDGLPVEARLKAEAVLTLRSEVLAACRLAADREPGRHSLTVPTGGGKTLAALAFALKHAMNHGLRRVIVVIPFTSIIDQTAAVYRKAFGEDQPGALIEHHSNLDPSRETYENRLASENWDAPVIVTTSVQFFESLFSRRGTAARKLHNIAGSVVVFDEVQTLPHHLRAPIFDALNQLVDHYGVSALFCTATQPALELKQVNRQDFPHFDGIQEVVPDVPAAFDAVGGRVVADFSRCETPTAWEDLAAEVVRDHNRVLVIVQRRDDARDLCRLLPPDTFHLSALMCAAHRREVLAQIGEALLKPGKTCRVVSTTLVEAGVDLDFPIVYRALGGVDALAQAAGRCNRGGGLSDDQGRPVPGRLIVFRSPKEPPKGLIHGAETTKTLLKWKGHLDLFHPDTHRLYFKELFAKLKPDGTVMNARVANNFPEVDRAFRMIDDEGQAPVVVPYGKARSLIDAYAQYPPGYAQREALRTLQPYTVSMQEIDLDRLVAAGLVRPISDHVNWVDVDEQYHDRYGLILDRIVPYNPRSLVEGN